MRNRNINNEATVKLFVNGEQAADAMDRLRKKAEDLDKQLQAAMDTGDKKSANKLRRELDRVNKELNKTESAAKGTGIVLNNLSNSSIRGLNNALKHLQNELQSTRPNTEAWNAYARQIKEVQARIDELNGEFEEQRSLWERFKGWADTAWPALDLLRQWSGSFVDLGRQAVEAFAGMDQEMANVRKFTGMTESQVEDLNEAFKEMDTRTSREDLNKLAQEAGRLGKTSKEDVLGFVNAANQINVALDDLGDGATLTLSKLTGVFGDEQRYGTEQSLLKVGSVINELSQNCAASAPYLAEFASRMGGVGAQANMTIPQIMAFGAVLDSNGQQVEASSTALSQVIVRMMQEPAKYAKVAGLDVKKFSDMLKTDVNGALILFLETLQKAGGMDVLSPMFKDMGENGSRAIAALSTLATHIDDVKDQQLAANDAFRQGISVTNEYNVQNNTVQAGLDKCKKAAQEIRVELGERLQPLMSHMLSSTSAIMRALLTTVNFLIDNKTAVLSLTAAITAYNIVVHLAAIKTKAAVVWHKAWNATIAAGKVLLGPFRLAIAAVTNAVQYFTNGMQVSYAMQQRWRAAMAATNWAALAAAIVAAAAAFLIFRKRTDEVTEAQKALNDVKTEAQKKMADEKTKIDLLVAAARNEKLSLDERQKAIAALNRIIPNYNGQLDATTGKYRENKKALDDYLKSLTAKYELEGAKDKLAEIGKEKAEATIKQREAQQAYDRNRKEMENTNYLNGQYTSSFGMVGNSYFDSSSSLSKSLDEANNNLDIIKAKEKVILDTYGVNLQKDAVKSSSNSSESPTNTPSGTGYTSQVQAEKDAKKANAAARAAAVQARKEFKEQLDQIKAARDKEQTEIMALRMMGEINYAEYNKRKLAADEKYYDDSIALFEKWGIQESDECQAMARKREEFLNKANEQRLAINKEAIQRVAQAEERDLKARYAYKSSHTLAEELRLEEEILTIRYNALKDQQALYKKTDKEYEDYQKQIDDLLLQDVESKQKKLLAEKARLQQELDLQPVSIKFDMDRAAVNELRKQGELTITEYIRWMEKLRDKQAEAEKDQKENLPGMKEPDSFENRVEAARENADRQKKYLREALQAGIISLEEYEKALKRVDNELQKVFISTFKDCKSEWVSMLATMGESWKAFADALSDPDQGPSAKLETLSEAIRSTAGVTTSVLSMVTEFQKAEYEIQAKAVEKRYDAEIEAAEGNSYRTRKLEKEKEKELAKLKREQSRKQFALQVIATIAQTAANAVQAYSAGLAVGPPAGLVLAPIAAALAVAQGAAQIALIKKQQQAAEAQGYSKGGFTRPGAVDEPAGIVHAGEWVASQKLLANPVARPMIDALDYAQRTNTIGSLRSEDVSRSIRANDSLVRMAESDGSNVLVASAVAHNTEAVDRLNNRLQQPLGAIVTVTGDHGINKAQDEYDQYIKNKNPKLKK